MPHTDESLAAAAEAMPEITDDGHNVGEDMQPAEARTPVELPYDPAADDDDEEIG